MDQGRAARVTQNAFDLIRSLTLDRACFIRRIARQTRTQMGAIRAMNIDRIAPHECTDYVCHPRSQQRFTPIGAL